MKTVISAGGVVFRTNNGAIEVKLIVTKNGYSLPKGKLDGKESLEQCCLREIYEESGATVVIEDYLGEASWLMKPNKTKLVYAFLTRCIKDEKPNDPDGEILSAEWKSLKQAKQLVTFQPLNKVLEMAEEWFQKHQSEL